MDLRLKEVFPFFESALVSKIIEKGTIRMFSPGEELIREGQFIKSFPLILSGLIKITRQSKEGNELLLYYLKEKEVCSVSLTCCLNQKVSKIRAVAETETQAILLKTNLLEDWISTYPTWKQFVMQSIQSRFQELLETVDNIAFLRMYERLVKYFTDRFQFKWT